MMMMMTIGFAAGVLATPIATTLRSMLFFLLLLGLSPLRTRGGGGGGGLEIVARDVALHTPPRDPTGRTNGVGDYGEEADATPIVARDATESLRFDQDRYAVPFFARTLRGGDQSGIAFDLAIDAHTFGLVLFFGQLHSHKRSAYMKISADAYDGRLSVRIGSPTTRGGFHTLTLASPYAVNDGVWRRIKVEREARGDGAVGAERPATASIDRPSGLSGEADPAPIDRAECSWRLSIDGATADVAVSASPCDDESAPHSALWIGGIKIAGVTPFQGMRGFVTNVVVGGRPITLFKYVARTTPAGRPRHPLTARRCRLATRHLDGA
jgi:hypothetical protein